MMMEINKEVLSGLNLINSPQMDKNDLQKVFDACRKVLCNCAKNKPTTKPEQSQLGISDDKSVLYNILAFSIESLLLEAVKHNVNSSALTKILQDQGLDCTTENYKLLNEFIEITWNKVHHNLSHLELHSLPKFRDLEWSQMLDVKSSIVDCIKEKSYLVEFQVDSNSGSQSQQQQSTLPPLTLSQRELLDLHGTLQDCANSLQGFLYK